MHILQKSMFASCLHFVQFLMNFMHLVKILFTVTLSTKLRCMLAGYPSTIGRIIGATLYPHVSHSELPRVSGVVTEDTLPTWEPSYAVVLAVEKAEIFERVCQVSCLL
jgi:hypothetical protein